ncbi:MAG: flagellar hook-associated protein FlgL [Steroidobacteraceae bacterium]
MRISTSTIQQGALDAMLRQQAQLARTQNEVATGRRIQSPADDPPAAARLAVLERGLAESNRFGANADVATNRLQYEEQAIADATDTLQRMQELALQANNSLLDDDSRRMIGAELEALLQGLTDIANRQDASGEYLFSGYSTRTRPFERDAAGFSFRGDPGVRFVQIGPSQRIADGHSGEDVFVQVREGNGTFVTAARAANTGTGIVSAGALLDPAAWVRDDYTVSFTAPDTYEIRDSSSALVATGSYTAGAAISFNGVSLSIGGTPATGDVFEVNAAGTQTLFETAQSLVDAVNQGGAAPAGRAQFATRMGTLIEQLSTGIDHLSGIRAEIGSRISTIESSANAREQLAVETQKVISDLRDIDYAEAITRMNSQLVALQAAQQSYTRLSSLSLFNYL